MILQRATSEPPPDVTEVMESTFPITSEELPAAGPSLQQKGGHSLPALSINTVQEYSWDWGAFPQPSPLKPTFNKSGRVEPTLGNGTYPAPGGSKLTSKTWGRAATKSLGKRRGAEKAMTLLSDIDQDEEDVKEGGGRSRSVPPGVKGSPWNKRNTRSYFDDMEDWEEDEDVRPMQKEYDEVEYGTGGRMKASKADRTVFQVNAHGQKSFFELSIISVDESSSFPPDERGRKGKDGLSGGVSLDVDITGMNSFDLEIKFDEGKIDFDKFIQDESIVNHPGLVIRWAGSQSVSCAFGPCIDLMTFAQVHNEKGAIAVNA
jgi:phosphatidate phosphatase LPIN